MDPACGAGAVLNHFRRRGCGFFSRNERNAALGFMKGRGFVDAPLSLRLAQPPKRHMQPVLKILLDLLIPS